jgi:hypothetical protein
MPFFSEALHRGHLHRTSVDRRASMESTKPPAGEVRTPAHAEIAKLAYTYWEARGRQHGLAIEDWLRAERELHARK